MSSWTWGKVGYEKFLESWRDSGHWIDPFIPAMDWDDLPLDLKEAWGAAAQAVRDAARA